MESGLNFPGTSAQQLGTSEGRAVPEPLHEEPAFLGTASSFLQCPLWNSRLNPQADGVWCGKQGVFALQSDAFLM